VVEVKWLILTISLFLVYLIFINIFGNYTIIQTKNYRLNGNYNNSGLFENIGTQHSVTVEVKRAKMFFGLFPTRIYIPFPKLYVENGVYLEPIKWREVNIRYLNYFVVGLFVASIVFIIWYDKRNKKWYEDYMKEIEKIEKGEIKALENEEIDEFFQKLLKENSY